MSDALPILTQRRIEAAFAKGVYDEMKAELGEATAKRILAGAVIKLAKQAAAEMARAGAGRRAKPRLVPRHPAALDRRGRAAHRSGESTDSEFHFNVTRCRYAEMYRAMGLADLGARAVVQPRRRVLRGLRSAAEAAAHADPDGRRHALRLPLSVARSAEIISAWPDRPRPEARLASPFLSSSAAVGIVPQENAP